MQGALKVGVFSAKGSKARSFQCKELTSKESLMQGALVEVVFSVLKELSSKETSVQGALKQGVFIVRCSQARSLQWKELSSKEFSVQGHLKQGIFSIRSSHARIL